MLANMWLLLSLKWWNLIEMVLCYSASVVARYAIAAVTVERLKLAVVDFESDIEFVADLSATMGLQTWPLTNFPSTDDVVAL